MRRSVYHVIRGNVRPPADFCAARLRGYRRDKIPDATLCGSTMCLSIEARVSIIGLFLPHIMAADPWWPPQAKRRKKGLARLCGSTFGALVLCLQRLRRNWRHIIWRQFAIIWFMPTFGDSFQKYKTYSSWFKTSEDRPRSYPLTPLVVRVATRPSWTCVPALAGGPPGRAGGAASTRSDDAGDRDARGQTSASSAF